MKQSQTSLAVIIGFDAFGDLDTNPSQLAVELLAKSHIDDQIKKAKGKTAFKTLILPTASQKAWSKLRQTIKQIKNQKFVLVLSGYAQKRSHISIERFALNIKDYRIPDNSGTKIMGQAVVSDGQNAFKTSIDVAKLAKHLEKKGFACEVSNHAGTFICNEIYYRALHAWEKNKLCQGIIFIHLPSPNSYKKVLISRTTKNKKTVIPNPIKTYSECLAEVALQTQSRR